MLSISVLFYINAVDKASGAVFICSVTQIFVYTFFYFIVYFYLVRFYYFVPKLVAVQSITWKAGTSKQRNKFVFVSGAGGESLGLLVPTKVPTQ